MTEKNNEKTEQGPERELSRDELELLADNKLGEIDAMIHAFNETCAFHEIDKVIVAFVMTSQEAKDWMEEQNVSEE